MQVFNFSDIFSENAIKEFHQWLHQATWYSGVPGGFVTNSPKRLVNAYGDGSTMPANADRRWTESCDPAATVGLKAGHLETHPRRQ